MIGIPVEFPVIQRIHRDSRGRWECDHCTNHAGYRIINTNPHAPGIDLEYVCDICLDTYHGEADLAVAGIIRDANDL